MAIENATAIRRALRATTQAALAERMGMTRSRARRALRDVDLVARALAALSLRVERG